MGPALPALLLLLAPQAADLTPATLDGWKQYIASIEPKIIARNQGGANFLWTDETPKRTEEVLAGNIVVEQTKTPEIKDGMIQHWTGSVFIPNVTLNRVIAVDQDYARHKVLYKPDVVDSRILSRNGDNFHIFLRLRKHKVVTAILDTEHDVEYRRLAPNREYSRSVSTSIREVRDAGESDEKVLPMGEGFGFMWALNSYWRLQERNGGVIAECDAVSLSRDVPFGTGAMLGPIIRSLGEESLKNTLESKRRAVAAGK